MIKQYTVINETKEDGTPYVDVWCRDAVGDKWIQEFADYIEDKFSYKVIRKHDGFDDAIWHLKNNDKKIHFLYDIRFGVEIHPDNRQAEDDMVEMGEHLKEALASLPDSGPPADDEI